MAPEVIEELPRVERRGRRLVYGEDERVGRWIAARTNGEWRPGAKCIGLENNGELIAGTLYDWHNGASIFAHIAAEGSHWLNREFLWHIFYFPFRQLGCKVIIGVVAEGNFASRRFIEHLGFTLHTQIPNGHPTGALFIYLMRPEECRWLAMKEAA